MFRIDWREISITLIMPEPGCSQSGSKNKNGNCKQHVWAKMHDRECLRKFRFYGRNTLENISCRQGRHNWRKILISHIDLRE